MSLPGEARFAELWPAIRQARDDRLRNALVDSAVTGAAWLQQEVYEARMTAVRLMLHGADTDADTLKKVQRWKNEATP